MDLNGFENNIGLTISQLSELLIQKHWRLSVAESCTGGWVAKVITDVAGSSQWFDRGFVTYSNQAKQSMLLVNEQTISDHGAVSEPVAAEMVAGVVNASMANVGLAITGIAGPGGGSTEKPVGMVWFAWKIRGRSEIITQVQVFKGNRNAVRMQAVQYALSGLIEVIVADEK